MGPAAFVAIILAVVAVIFLAKWVRIVPQGYEWTVERFGKYTRTLPPGLHLLFPVIYAVGRKMNMM
ncbi:MAG TPA: SPFH domain-containing protein, partial [Rhodanobacteraceae bacterium]|nr:SPFH domain-containing protein [Rhodanobacteraceae bacterium]